MRKRSAPLIGLRLRWPALPGLLLSVVFIACACLAAESQPTPLNTRLELTEGERKWLAEHANIRVGVNPNYPPFDFVDGTGTFSGMSADYLKLIAQRLGIRFSVVSHLSWSDALDAVKDGRVDVVAGLKNTEARRQSVIFTADYLTFPLVIITRDSHRMIAGLPGLRGETLAMVKNYASTEEARARNPNLNLRLVPSPLEALRAVERGDADATVLNIGSAAYLIAKRGIRGVVVAAPAGLEDARSAFGVRKDWPLLAQLMDKALASITLEEEDAIRSKWISAPYDARIATDRLRNTLVWVGSGAAIVVILVLVWNRYLKGEVTRRRAAENALADQLLYQRALLDTVPNPIYIKDKEARFIGCNLAYEQAFRTKREMLVGKTVHELPHIPPEMREAIYQRDREILQTRKSVFVAERLPFWDGPRDTLFWISSFDLADGTVGGLVGAIVDVSAQKALERQARDSERRLREMANSVPGVVYQLRIDKDGTRRYSFLSDAVRTLRGYSGEEASGNDEPLLRQVLDEDKPLLDRAIANAVETLTPLLQEYRIRTPDGTLKWLQSAAVPNKTEDGAVILNGYWIDVTEHREMEIELAQARSAADAANRAKSSFLAGMSHEIRTPMNGVLGMLELLSLTRLDQEQRAIAEVVRESGRSLLRIVDDILDFSKIEAGMFDLRPEPASIDHIVSGVTQVYSGAASAKRLALTGNVDPRISPAVMVDPLRLRQILNNFVSNAIKFTAEGSITIGAELVSRANGIDTVRLAVTDTGIGISPENQKKLFQPFVQAESDTTRRFGGTGLGLVICRRIADLMGGTIEMDSEVGRGTTMRLVVGLPQADPALIAVTDQGKMLSAKTLAARRAAPDVDAAAAEGTLVLAVDDHPTNRMLLKRQLNMLGYAAETAENGGEALASWRSARFALVITDCHMPEMDGYDLARSIRDEEGRNGGHHTPILACTANVLEGESEACLAAGMDGYVAKPVELGALLKALDRWLPLPDASNGAGAKMPVALANAVNGQNASPIDRTKLAEVSLGDQAFEREMLTDFRAAAEEDAKLLVAALDAGDCAAITRISHRIKGASQTIGAMSLAVISEQMEKAGRADDHAGIAAAREPLFHEVERLQQYLETL
jgi:PAS domain S-box-containing protein